MIDDRQQNRNDRISNEVDRQANVEQRAERFVSWQIFVWTVAIVTTLLGALWIIQISIMSSISDIKTDVGVIKNDLSWIKQKIDVKPLTIQAFYEPISQNN